MSRSLHHGSLWTTLSPEMPNDLSRSRIVELDKRYVWHPYTPMRQYIENTEPLVIERAQGARIFDKDGRGYIDGNSSWWVAVLGHNHPRLVERMRLQAETMCHVSLAGIAHEQAARLAEEMLAVAPAGLSRVFYSDDGSTAVEVALKMCLQYWFQQGKPTRNRVVALQGAFHGETLGATAVGGVSAFRSPFESSLMQCLHVPTSADETQTTMGGLERVLEEGQDEIAAVIAEPILQGAGGMRLYDTEYLRQLRALTRQCDVFLILDEVFTGYGRTGPMWATEHAGVTPDVLCVGKGFTAGVLPMAATLVSERIFEGFTGDPDRALYYGHTYCGHPLGAAIAREVLSVYEDEQILERAKPKAARIQHCFERLSELPGVENARSLGMMGALDLQDKDGKEGYLSRSGWRVYEEALKRGAYLRPLGNVVYTVPPLNIPDSDLEELLEILSASVKKVVS